MTGPLPALDLDDFRRRAADVTRQRREARRDYERYAEQAADADREYRKTLATAFITAKAGDATVKQAELEADAEAADARHKRAIAESLAKAALLRVEECERDAATLRTVYESGRREGLA